MPVGAALFTFGVYGWLGVTGNLFHLLGAFLGICIALDYAIFAEQARVEGRAFPASIRVSMATTFAAFAILGISRIPAVDALAWTVCLVTLSAFVLSYRIATRGWKTRRSTSS